MTRTAIYARVSTADQTCSQQLAELRSYVAARRWELQGEYVDQASGTKVDRPAMKRLFAAARRRQIDVICVSKMDRWGRSLANFVSTVQELTALGVRFIATSQGIDTDESNPTSRLLLNLLAAFAEFERELIVERTRAGLERARRQGKQIGRPRRIVDVKAAARLHARGMSMAEISRRLKVSSRTIQRRLASQTQAQK